MAAYIKNARWHANVNGKGRGYYSCPFWKNQPLRFPKKGYASVALHRFEGVDVWRSWWICCTRAPRFALRDDTSQEAYPDALMKDAENVPMLQRPLWVYLMITRSLVLRRGRGQGWGRGGGQGGGSHLIGNHNSDDGVMRPCKCFLWIVSRFLVILTLKTQDYGLCSGTMQLFVEIFWACKISSDWAYSRMQCVEYDFLRECTLCTWRDLAGWSSLHAHESKPSPCEMPNLRQWKCLQCYDSSMVIRLLILLHAPTEKANRDGLTKPDVRSLWFNVMGSQW